MRSLLNCGHEKPRFIKSLLAIVLVIAFFVQATFPPVSAAMQQKPYGPSAIDSQNGTVLSGTEGKGVLLLHPRGEFDTMILFSTAYLSVTGTSRTGEAFPEIVPVHSEIIELELPYGEYLITAHYSMLTEGFDHFPSYFMSKKVTVNEETDHDYTVIGGMGVARLSVNTTTEGTKVASVCLYPEDRDKSAPTYIQPDQQAKSVYITPGSYDMIIAVTDGNHGYFLSTSFVAESDQEININADLNFTASLIPDKNEYMPGETVHLTCQITDSFGNRLIGKTTGLPLEPFSTGYVFSDEAPVVEIKDETGAAIHSVTKKADNAAIYEYWASFSPNIHTELYPMLSTDSTFTYVSFDISADDFGGIRTLNTTLGEGPHVLSTAPSSFHIKGEAAKPVLDPLQSPVNASNIVVTGVATPNTEVILSCSFNQGEEVVIGMVTSDPVTGRFSFTYTPEQDGTYTFTANDSYPVSLIIDRTPTGAPSNLEGTVNEQGEIILNWEAPEGETPVRYEAVRDGVSLGFVITTSFTDSTVDTSKDATYTYSVYAFDASGNRSEQAQTVVEINIPEEPIELVISNVFWTGSWDMRKHINRNSTLHVTVQGTPEMEAEFDLEYTDQAGLSQILTGDLSEINNPDGNGTGEYEGALVLPDHVARVDKITGRIIKGSQRSEKEAVGFPAFVNAELSVTLSGINDDMRDIVKKAELSVWSNSKYAGGKAFVTDTFQCDFTKLVPSDDYIIKLTYQNKVIAQSEVISLTAGSKLNIDLPVVKTPAALNVWVKDKDGNPIKQANINVFAKENSLFLALANTDESGKAVHTPYSSASSDYLLDGVYSGDELIIQVTLSDYEKYITPVKVLKTLETGVNDVTVTIEERGRATVKGTVFTEQGDSLSAATVTAYCDTDENHTIPYSVITDANGNYSLDVLSGKVRIVISHDLSRSKEFTIEPLTDGEIRTEQFWFPIEKKILLDIKFRDIGEPDGYSDLFKERKVGLTVTNKGTTDNPKNDVIRAIRGDDRYLAVGDAQPGDIIEVTADGSAAGYDTVTVLSPPLDENCWANMSITLNEFGKIKATFTDLYGDLNYPVYFTVYRQNNDTFEYVTQMTVLSTELLTSPLLPGLYNVFVHTVPVNAGIRYQYFLEDSADHAVLYPDVEVKNGEIIYIGETILKAYEDTGWGYFRDNEGNEIRASMTDVIPGGTTTITVSYKYTDLYPLRKVNFFIDIPDGSTYVEDSIKINPKNNSKEPKPYFLTDANGRTETINLLLGGSYQLPLGDIEGSVTFSIRFDEEPKNALTTARYYVTFDGPTQGMREHIGEVIFSTPYVSIYAEEDIYDHIIPVSGRAPKNAIVKIYDSAYFVGETRANQHGLWSTTVTLPDRGMPKNHYLSAQIQNNTGDWVSSDIIECSYDTDRPRITQIVFGVEGLFKKVIKKNESFRYKPDSEKKQEVEIYFDDASRIRDLRLMTASGLIIVHEEDVVYHENENMFSASWLTPIVTDEIRVSYRVAKPEAKLSDYTPVAEDVLRSGLPELWGKSTFIQQPALSYNEGNDTFEIHSKVLLGDKNSVVSTTMEISNYEGDLPLGYSNDADLPIGNLFVKFYEDETFEISFIMPRDVLFQEVFGENGVNSRVSLMSAASIPLIATRVPQQLVRVFGKKTVIEAGLDSYSLVDTFLGGHSTAKFLEKVYALEAEIKSPCYNQFDYNAYQDRRDIELLEYDTKVLFGAKSVLSIAFLGLGFIPVVGWGAAIGLAVATTVAGYLVDKGIEAYQEKQYEDLRGRIRSRAKPGCSWPRDNYKDDSDSIARPRPFMPIDPSGYVYEGVASNRVEGVVATAYELIDDQWQIWDAEWFAQENPLVTDEVGFYQWDVPEGWWMVKYEKEGYEIAYSDKLPVPPPQLDVNIPLVSLKLPEITNVETDHEGKVTLTFSQYMDVSYINEETFKLFQKERDETDNLIAVVGSITPTDAEASPSDNALILARTFVFTPSVALKPGDVFTLWVDDMPVNYAGRSLAEETTLDLTVPEKQDPPEEPEDEDHGPGDLSPVIIPQRQIRILNYTLKEGEDPNSVLIYRKDIFGNLHPVKESYYDPVTKMIRFVAKPATIYVAGVNPVRFHDLGLWADEYIMFLAARGIIRGVGNNRFEPNRFITRGEFIKLLACLAEDEFQETEPWYTPYVQWAMDHNVIDGNDTDFNLPLAREDMAVMIDNFTLAVGLGLPITQSENTFKDQDLIAVYAINAVSRMQKAGLLQGKPGGLFDPKGFTTRAEAAKIIALLLKMKVK